MRRTCWLLRAERVAVHVNTSHLLDVNASHLLDMNTSHLLDVNASHLLDLNTSHLLDVNASHLLDVNASHLLDVNTSPVLSSQCANKAKQWGVCAPRYVDANRKRNFWLAVMVKSYICICVSTLQAVCTNSPVNVRNVPTKENTMGSFSKQPATWKRKCNFWLSQQPKVTFAFAGLRAVC